MMSNERSGNEMAGPSKKTINTVAPMQANMSVGEALERAQSAYLDCCFDEPVYGDENREVDSQLEYVRSRVGSNPLIVDSILKYCDKETLGACRLVNHFWRNLTLNRTKMYLKRASDEVLEQVLQNKENLEPFNTIRIMANLPTNLPVHWMSYSPNLTCLELFFVTFEEPAEVCRIIFDYFPCMKILRLIECAVKPDAKNSEESEEDFETTTPQLQELTVGCICDKLFPTLLFNLVKIAIPKLRNLKKLTWGYYSSSFQLPLFAALTLGNIHLESLFYMAGPGVLESETVIRDYFRVCGGSLQHIHVPEPLDILHRIIQEEVSPTKLRRLYLQCSDYTPFLKEECAYMETLEIDLILQRSCSFFSKLPNLKTVKINLCFLPILFKGAKGPGKQQFQNLSVKRLEITAEGDEYDKNASVELWHSWYDIIQAFPNVVELKLEGYAIYNHLYIALEEFMKVWPRLTRLELVTPLPSDAGNKWRGVLASVALCFRDLETFIYHDAEIELDQLSIFPLLSLPKLRTVKLAKAKIPMKLYELLNTHFLSLDVSDLTLDE